MNELITVFYSLAGLGLLLWIIMVEYPALQLEQTREKLYGLRRQLFYIGQERQIFHQRAYTMNRYVINGMLRYLDKLSFIRFIVAVYLEDEINEQKNVRAYKQKLEQSYKGLPHDVISEVDGIRDDANATIISYLVKTSPVALALSSILALFVLLFMTSKLLSFLRNAIPAFEAGAERMGEGRVYGT